MTFRLDPISLRIYGQQRGIPLILQTRMNLIRITTTLKTFHGIWHHLVFLQVCLPHYQSVSGEKCWAVTEILAKRYVSKLHSLPIGKRACPGENLAAMELFLLIATLIQHFRISESPGQELKENIVPGFARLLAPFQVIVSER